MKILFLTRRFYPDIGGVEKHVLEVSKQLVAQGYKVNVLTESKSSIKKTPFKNIQIIRLPFFPEGKMKKFAVWQWLWSNRKLILDADIIHCHDVFYWYFPFRFLYPRKPVFTTFHGYESYPIKQKAILVRKISEKLSWGNICIGDFIKKWYKTTPTYISYGAVDSPKLKAQSLQSPQKYSALFFGRLDEQTGVMQYMRLVFAVYDNPVKEDYLKLSPFSKFIIFEKTSEKLAEKVTYFLENPNQEKILIDKAYSWVKNQSWSKMAELYCKLWKQ
jgi:glycosyltransferase involved in cell wall biosynthesis